MENIFNKLWKVGLVIIVLTIAFGGIVLITISTLSAFIVLGTYGYSLMTNQDYEMVCHHSNFIWNMNQWGKATLLICSVVLLIGFAIV